MEKLKEMEQLFDTLNDKNKDVLIMVANAMKVAQNVQVEGVKNEN